MRRRGLEILCLVPLIGAAAGCHQTAGPAAGTALSPVSPLGAPASTPASPATAGIGPFGGSTRVPPPGTGSYSTANNYLGGVAPIDATSRNGSSPAAHRPQAGSLAAAGSQAIGSGVRPTAWTETQTISSGGGASSAGGLQPRLSGMPVIDLTQAPPPPGYRPTAGTALPLGPVAASVVPPAAAGTSGGFPANGSAVAPVSHSTPAGPMGGAATAAADSGPTLRLAPVAPQLRDLSTGPSTDPIHAGNSARRPAEDLPWRPPSPRY